MIFLICHWTAYVTFTFILELDCDSQASIIKEFPDLNML